MLRRFSLVLQRMTRSRACRGRRVGCVGLLCVLTFAATARGDDPLSVAQAIEEQFVEVIARCEGAVVSIVKVKPAARERGLGFHPLRGPLLVDRPIDLTAVPESFGSGVVIASDAAGEGRFVLTNYHVLQPDAGGDEASAREPVYVRLSNHRAVRASVVAADPRSDLAVLRLDLFGSGIDPAEVKPITLGDASGIRKGQLVLALGNPYALARDGSASASWGLISNISRHPEQDEEDDFESGPDGTIHQYGTLLHVDTSLALGTSGGALVDLQGKLIGLTTALAALEGYEKSVGFAIPIDEAMRRVVETLLKGYEVEYGFLGIQPGDVRPEELRLLRGPRDQFSAARAIFVSAGSPADRGGLRNDDLILRINDKQVRSADDVMREIALLGPGAVARIDLWRPSRQQRLQLEVTLGKWPVRDDSRIVASRRRYPTWRGLDVDYPTARRRFLTSDVMERYHHAVLVLAVAEGSAASAAGVRAGDFLTHVEGIAVETPQRFHEAIAGRAGSVTLTRLDGTEVKLAPPSQD
jgi:serine protease Do